MVEYAVVMDVDDWLVVDSTMDDELDRLSQQGWDFDDWGEPTRDPQVAELSELGLSIRQVGWDRFPESQRAAGGRQAETVRLTARQWSLVVFALESRSSDAMAQGVRPEYVEILKNIAARRRQLASLLRRRLTDSGLTELPVLV